MTMAHTICGQILTYQTSVFQVDVDQLSNHCSEIAIPILPYCIAFARIFQLEGHINLDSQNIPQHTNLLAVHNFLSIVLMQ